MIIALEYEQISSEHNIDTCLQRQEKALLMEKILQFTRRVDFAWLSRAVVNYGYSRQSTVEDDNLPISRTFLC